MSSWSFIKWLKYTSSGFIHVLLNVHGLNVSVYGLLLDQSHGVQGNLLSSRVIVAPTTMPLTGKVAFQGVLREDFAEQVLHVRDA